MASFSGLGIGLSLVFGCLLLACVAELYYLIWSKRRVTNREIEANSNNEYSSNYAKEFFHLLCWKKSSCLQNSSSNSSQERLRDHQETTNCQENQQQEEQDLELGTTRSKDILIKAFADQESAEAELMRLHNLSGPPRFLFTIKEETKEDLESEDGKSRGDRSRKGSRTRSLSDLLFAVDTPNFLTPLASPRLKPSPLDSYNQHYGFNPLFESSSVEAEITRVRSSPPPTFKFLRDAEEKLLRKLMEEAEKKVVNKATNSTNIEEITTTEGSFLGIIVGKNKERDLNNLFNQIPQYPSSSSQVLPLASSPKNIQTTRQESQCPLI